MDRRLAVIGSVLAGVGAGAGIMYLLDPSRGKRRRAVLKDRVTAVAHDVGRAVDVVERTVRDARNRGYGLYAGARYHLRREPDVPDAVLEARVRSRLGRAIEHPERIEIGAKKGLVSVGGHVPAADAEALMRCVAHVKGVREVANRINVH